MAAEPVIDTGSAAPSSQPSDKRDLGATIVSHLRGLARLRDGRVAFSLNPVGVTVVAGAILLALLVSYELGRRTPPSGPAVASDAPGLAPGLDVAEPRRDDGRSATPVELRGTESAPPVPARPVPPRPEPTAASPNAANKAQIALPAAPPAVVSGRVPGLNYIIVERFHTGLPQVKSLEDAKQQAEQAQKWLAERCDLQTTLYPMSNGKGYELWTVQGFKHPEQTPQREELADKIRSYGKLYAKEGHYLFGCEVRKYQGPAEGHGSRSRD
jgi:hypothetical protein